jgi:hypothetical protein
MLKVENIIHICAENNTQVPKNTHLCISWQLLHESRRTVLQLAARWVATAAAAAVAVNCSCIEVWFRLMYGSCYMVSSCHTGNGSNLLNGAARWRGDAGLTAGSSSRQLCVQQCLEPPLLAWRCRHCHITSPSAGYARLLAGRVSFLRLLNACYLPERFQGQLVFLCVSAMLFRCDQGNVWLADCICKGSSSTAASASNAAGAELVV